MPFTWGRDDYERLRKLLARQSFLKTPDGQLGFVTGLYANTPDAKILDQLGTRGDSFTYAVYLLEQLGNYDDGRVSKRMVEGLIERLGPGDDVDFLNGLLARYFGGHSPIVPAVVPSPPPAVEPVTVELFDGEDLEPTPFMADLERLRADLRTLHEDDRDDVTQIIQAVTLQQAGQDEIRRNLDELAGWAAGTLRDLRGDQAAIRAQLETLAQHNLTANQYVMASIPIVPGLLSYNVELGSGHTADLRAIWEKLRGKVSGIRARGEGRRRARRPEQAPTRAPRSHAILVGVTRYAQNTGLSELQYCARDVAAVEQVLAQAGYLTQIFADGKRAAPIREDVLSALVAQAENAAEGDLLLFYFSGHGTTEKGEGYLLPRNTRVGIMADTAIKTARVLEIMNESPARAKVLVLDACHSGAQIGKASAEMTAEFIEQVYRQAEGVAVLASCAQKQVSWEDVSLRHGAFTSAMLEGLSGLADFDGKGFVSVQDLNRYARERVAAWGRAQSKVQTPTLKYDGSGDIVLIDT
jgi:hypothetical protein